MKFLVDAQLPRHLVRRLREAGHEALHTLDLPLGNRTADAAITALSLGGQYVVSLRIPISLTLSSCGANPTNCS